MKKWVIIALICTSHIALGQKDKSTDGFIISGDIVKELSFTISDLRKYQQQKIIDIVITNHLGEKKGIAKELRGILLKDLLEKIEINAESPKVLSEFFLTFIASDGYKVVYSWNEIFNTETGNNIFLITSKEGKDIQDMTERILIITTTDFKTGRRNIKGLSKIIVKRAD